MESAARSRPLQSVKPLRESASAHDPARTARFVRSACALTPLSMRLVVAGPWPMDPTTARKNHDRTLGRDVPGLSRGKEDRMKAAATEIRER